MANLNRSPSQGEFLPARVPSTPSALAPPSRPQTVTMYRGPDGFEAKDFAFKLQSVKVNSKGTEDRKTVAKIHVDLSTYCTGQVNPQPVEKTFTLK